MAKKTDTDEKKKAKARANRCNGYADKVRMMFSQTVNDILAIHKSVPTLEEGQMFSFDAEGTNKQNQVTTLLRKLHSNVVTAIKKGIGIEWDKANDDADKILGELFGNEIKNNPAFVGWLERNESAMSTFIKRTDKGMNLSDRIWKNVKQLREEMEVAMTVSIGEGESASTMSRKVKQCLNDPDLMFRRFRYKKGVDKDGNPIYGRKWKKRVKDEVTGKYKFIDYDKDSYPSGRGVYKSATKNAMRVTRTETNMAYRRADNKRWQNMNFVLGYRIKVAHDHKEKDICDMLQGDYPKEFVFDGWHPQCYCYCTPILMDEEEIIKMMKAKKEGKEYKPKGTQIKELPEKFKQWVKDNEDKINEQREKGAEPYFLRNNSELVDEIFNPKTKSLTTQEKAQKRHEARTQEQIDDIKKRWNERKKRQLIRKTANNIIKVADYYAEDIDTSILLEALHKNDFKAMKQATKEVTQKISELKKAEKQLTDIIPFVHKWHKKATIEELKNIHDSVKAKIEGWEVLSLEKQKDKLFFEAYTYIGGNMNGVKDKYPNTWEISQFAYIKKLNEVSNKIEINTIKDELSEIAIWLKSNKQSKKVAQFYEDSMHAITNGESLGVIKTYANQAKKEYEKRLKDRARRALKKNTANQGKVVFKEIDSEELERLLNEYNTIEFKEIDSALRKQTEEIWKSMTKEERIQVTKYTETYHYLNEPLRGQNYTGWVPKEEYNRDLPIMTSALSKGRMDKTMVVRRGTCNFDIKELGKKIKDIKEGEEFTDDAFLSTGVFRAGGFYDEINLKIVVPKGAQGVYAEPFSHYTDNQCYSYTNDIWDGKEKQYVNSEKEWIGQRGSRFKVLSNDGNGNIIVQIIGQLF